MMEIARQHVSEGLEHIARTLDISPTDFERARDRYQAIARWLEDGYVDRAYPDSSDTPSIHTQGSMRLGTVVRPLRNGKDAAYDVDLVCELQIGSSDWSACRARTVKHQIGNRLKANETYEKRLEEEKRRCWTIEYAEIDGVGFHIDILPSIPDPTGGNVITLEHNQVPTASTEYTQSSIAITDKYGDGDASYRWSSSNPRGYAKWFQERNITFQTYATRQKSVLLEEGRTGKFGRIYASIEDVPDELVRTPLQRTVQILKRHRDVTFNTRPEFKPISMIITTLSAHLYDGEQDLLTAVHNITTKLGYHSALIQDRHAFLHESVRGRNLIKRNSDGKWYIPNPVNPSENFADRWHEDNHARAKAFFEWVSDLQTLLAKTLGEGDARKRAGYLNEAFQPKGAKTLLEETAKSLSAALSPRPPSFFNVAHRQEPPWPVRISATATIIASAHRGEGGVKIQDLVNDRGRPLPKNLNLRYEVRTTENEPYDVYWQVVNTGEAAKRAQGLRGSIIHGKRVRWESTLYKGTHWIECFIVRGGVCVARSGEFVITID